MPTAVVVGSLHMDLIASASRVPGRGESVSGGTFSMAPGGKAGNQAIQLARMGIETYLLARVGQDQFGAELIQAMASAGVRTPLIAVDENVPTGASTIFAAEGDYSSIICPGAAANLQIDDLDDTKTLPGTLELAVLQRELPVSFINDAIQWFAGRGIPVAFNASPGVASREDFDAIPWSDISWLVVNEPEAETLRRLAGNAAADSDNWPVQLRQALGVATLVMTMGARGSRLIGPAGDFTIPAVPATVVDTVGAGDAFLGTFLAAVLDGLTAEKALRRASAAGAIAVGRRGAYQALPTRAEVDVMLEHAARNE